MTRTRTRGRAEFVENVETGLSLWGTPGGLAFYKVEVRAEAGRGGRKYRGSYHWDERTLAYARGESSLFRSKSDAKKQAQTDIGKVRNARATGQVVATAPKDKHRVKVADFVAADGEFEQWMLATLREGTMTSYLRIVRSLVHPLLKDFYLAQIDDGLVTQIRNIMRMPQCTDCQKKQAKERVAHQKEQRPMIRWGRCKPTCGYGIPDSTIATFTIVVGSMLKAAKGLGYIKRHPLRGGGDSQEFRYETCGGKRNPKRSDPATVLRVLPYAGPHAALATVTMLFQVERPQETLAHYWHDFLEPDATAPHGVRVRKTCRVVKSISYSKREDFHVVDGCEVPMHVVPKLKTTKQMDKKERFPYLWPEVGKMVLTLWLAEGKPPLASPMFVSESGRNAGYPPKSPAAWAQRHFRRPMEFCGLTYDRDDSFYANRHVGADLLAIGPRYTPHQISEYMGNSAETALKVYTRAVELPEYAGKSMPQIIRIAVQRAGLRSLVDIDYESAAAEMKAVQNAKRLEKKRAKRESAAGA